MKMPKSRKYGTSHMGKGLPGASGAAQKGNVPRAAMPVMGQRKAAPANRSRGGMAKGSANFAQAGEGGDGTASGRARTNAGKNRLGAPQQSWRG